MSTIKLAVAACGLLAYSGASAEDAAMAPVHQFIESLNAGDIKNAAAAHLPRSPIIDEFAPYH